MGNVSCAILVSFFNASLVSVSFVFGTCGMGIAVGWVFGSISLAERVSISLSDSVMASKC